MRVTPFLCTLILMVGIIPTAVPLPSAQLIQSAAPTVLVRIESARAVGAYQVRIRFNKDAVKPDALRALGGTTAGFTRIPQAVSIDERSGTMVINAFQVGNAPTGNLHVATVPFVSVGRGTADLAVEEMTLFDTDGYEIPTPGGRIFIQQ